MTEKTVLSIDPGTAKCGMALVTRTSANKLELLWRDIVPTESVVVKIHEAYAVKEFQLVILGNSTGSKARAHRKYRRRRRRSGRRAL